MEANRLNHAQRRALEAFIKATVGPPVTEADVVNFAGISGDYFYAHTDELAAARSLFQKRVAHGYFVLSAAAEVVYDTNVALRPDGAPTTRTRQGAFSSQPIQTPSPRMSAKTSRRCIAMRSASCARWRTAKRVAA